MEHKKIYVGVLLGAGQPIVSQTKKALLELIDLLFSKAQASIDTVETVDDLFLLHLAETLIGTMENSEYTNAGRGSELTIDGSIECDASVLFAGEKWASASVGAVPNVGNPSALCSELVRQQLRSPDPANNYGNITQVNSRRMRSIPNFIVGSGARDYGARMGVFSTGSPMSDLITDRAQRSFEKWNKNLSEATETNTSERYVDTVGLILIHGTTTLVVSSSGGALLKDSGRIGPASLVGCGLDSKDGVSAVCSGFGEDIISARLARLATSHDTELSKISHHLTKVILQRPPAQFGILRASQSSVKSGVHFEWIHTTPSMVCGYGSVTAHQQPTVYRIVSKQPQEGGRYIV